MTPREVAKWLRVDRNTIYQWRRAGVIPYVSFGREKGTVRFVKEDLEAWLRQKETVK